MTDLLPVSLHYVDFIRGKPCLVCGKPGEPDHLEEVGMGNNRKKPSMRHFSCVSLCRVHHSARHQLGLVEFQTKYAPPGTTLNLYREALASLLGYLSGIPRPFHNDRQIP